MKRRPAARLAVALLLVGGAGCRPVAGQLGDGPVGFRDAAGVLGRATRLDFGKVALGGHATLPLPIENAGTTQLLVDRIVRVNPFDPSFGFVEGSIELPPGTTTVSVSFDPSAPGAHLAELELQLVANGEVSWLEVHLDGIGVLPQCAISPGKQLDFGPLRVGMEQVRTLTVSNPGELGETLVVEQLTGDSAFVGPTPTEQVIAAGGLVSIPLSFKPTAAGTFTASLALKLPQECGPAVITLTGTALDRALTFAPELDFGYANPGTKVGRSLTVTNATLKDVTLAQLAPTQPSDFILSGSATSAVVAPGKTVAVSLDFLTQQLGQRTGTLTFAEDGLLPLHDASATSADYKIAVTTTVICTTNVCVGSGANGRFVPLLGGPPTLITPRTPNAAAVFSQNVSVGNWNSGTEFLIRPAFLALSSPLDHGWNAGFLRQDASLAVVVISDGVDDDTASLDFYSGFLRELKGGRGHEDRFTFSAMAPSLQAAPTGCSYSRASFGAAFTRVPDLVARSNGVLEEICTASWATALQNLGSRIFTRQARFFLTSTPDLSASPITVTAGGVNIPEQTAGGTTNWRYLPASDVLEFEPLAIPSPGTTLEVSYLVKC